MFYIYIIYRDEFVTGRIFHVKSGPFDGRTQAYTAVGLVNVESRDIITSAFYFSFWQVISDI